MKAWLQHRIEGLEARSLRRTLRDITRRDARSIDTGHGTRVQLSSNDYLGLSQHPSVLEAARSAITQWGAGSTASCLISGHSELHAQLERALAEFLQVEAALVFSSGYAANVGSIGALVGSADIVFADQLVHASIVDGARLAGAELVLYPHRDMDALRQLLQDRSEARHRLIATDGVFSMDGDHAPLDQAAELSAEFDAWLLVDDAHGLGVLGAQGRGCAELYEVGNKVDIHVGTLSKALGSQGGFVAGSRELIDTLIQRGRSYVYSTGLAPACVGAAIAGLSVLIAEPERRQRLSANSRRVRSTLDELKLTTVDGDSAVIAWILGDSATTLAAADCMDAEGVFAPAVRPPTVPNGKSRLRMSVSSEHNAADMDRIVNALHKAAASHRQVAQG